MCSGGCGHPRKKLINEYMKIKFNRNWQARLIMSGLIIYKLKGKANMSNRFTNDILIQVADVTKAAQFYVDHLGFEITDETRDSHTHTHMISVHGDQINLFIDKGEPLGPVLEVKVDNVEAAKSRLLEHGCTIVRWEESGPRYIRDPNGLIYHITL